MAAPKRNRTGDQEVRKKIQTSQLVNRIQSNGLGKLKKEMTLGQIRCALALINKTIPDLQSVQHSGDANNPIQIVCGWQPPT